MKRRNITLLLAIPLLLLGLVIVTLNDLNASPLAQASPTARYRLTFNAEWSAQTHPTDFPSNPHFSGLAGGTHTSDVSFWLPGAIASDGIEQMAETGSTSILQSEVQAAIANGTAGRVLAGGSIPDAPGSVSMEIFIRREYPLVSIVAMLAPSPDWFIGVHDYSLIDGQGNWISSATVSLDPYDSGTDSSPSYNHSENDTNPPEPIRNLRGVAPFSDARVGTFTFERLDAPTDPTNTPTATSAPPTATPVPPTATSVPPSATPQPSATSGPPEGQCGGLRQEAEMALIGSGSTGNGAFRIGQDSAASGGQYIEALDARSSGQFSADANATFCVNVPSTGTYAIRARAQALDSSQDSLYVYVDGTPSAGNTWHLWSTGNYEVTDLWVAAGNNSSTSRLEVQLTAGEHQIAFAGRERGARLDWIELLPISSEPEPTATPASTATPVPTVESTATPAPTPTADTTPVADCGGLQQEAEQGALSGLFGIGADGAASGGEYVHVANGQGNRGSSIDTGQKVSFCMNVNSPGTYRLKGWVYGPNGADNSFYVRVNGQPNAGIVWHTSINAAYTGEHVVAYNASTNRFGAVEFTMGAGPQLVEFYLREDGTRLDRIALEQMVFAASVNSGFQGDGFQDDARLRDDIAVGAALLDTHLYLPLLIE